MKIDQIHRPEDLQWAEGPLPSPDSVPYGTSALIWVNTWEGRFMGIYIARTWKDNLNPLRWSGAEYTGHPYGSIVRHCIIDAEERKRYFRYKGTTPTYEIVYENAEMIVIKKDTYNCSVNKDKGEIIE